jgi:hypothetical protein
MPDSITPFLAIWTDPRATIRRIVETEPTRNVLALALVGGGLGALESAWFAALGHPATVSRLWPIAVAFRVAFGAVWGVIGLYAAGWLVGVFCRALGGVASSIELRAALAWSSIPGITATALSIAAVLLGVINPPHFGHHLMPKMNGSTAELGLLNGVLIFWGFIVQLKCIGEVNRFSAWRAFTAIILIAVALTVLLILLVYLAQGMAGHRVAAVRSPGLNQQPASSLRLTKPPPLSRSATCSPDGSRGGVRPGCAPPVAERRACRPARKLAPPW